jgi:hypothetical protein
MTSQTVNTRVESVNNVPQVEFQDPSTNQWGTEITVTCNEAGTVTFNLEPGNTQQSYIFFGATQKITEEPTGSSDTNWSFAVNNNGTDIVFTTNDKVEQTIGIKLALIPINTDDLLNDVISADPSIKNVPPQ